MATGKSNNCSLCSGIIGVIVACAVTWLGYTICLVVHSVEIFKSFLQFKSGNISILQETTQELLLKHTMLSFIGKWLISTYLPQYLLCGVYGIAMFSALLDILCQNRIRLQFITAFLTTVSSVVFFLSFAASLLGMVLYMVCIKGFQHYRSDEIEILKTNQGEAGTTTPPVLNHVLKDGELQSILQWLSAQIFFMVLMFVIYLVYFCYWPHSLRLRNKKSRVFTKLGPQDVSDDEL